MYLSNLLSAKAYVKEILWMIEAHLIPLVLHSISGRRTTTSVFGQVCDTPYGTCIRDYIHDVDLCDARWPAFFSLKVGSETQALNLDDVDGLSIPDAIDTAHWGDERDILVLECPRPTGVPARLVTDTRMAHERLSWQSKFVKLATIIEHVWKRGQENFCAEKTINAIKR